MIVSVYPVLGKTSICENNYKYIDLDSSLFNDYNSFWYINYCRTAKILSDMGYIVFVSSHKEVINEFIKWLGEYVCIVRPDISTQLEHVDRLKERFDKTGSEKDYKAYEFMRDNFCDCVNESEHMPNNEIIIENLNNYNLEEIINYIESYERCNKWLKEQKKDR